MNAENLSKLNAKVGAEIRGEREFEIELSTLRAELATVKAERDDWRDIAIGLRDFGGPPLPKHQRQFGEVLERYLERLRKEGA